MKLFNPTTDLILLMFLVAMLAIYRNHWLFHARQQLVKDDSDYEKLPGYYSCYFRFWIWNINNF